MCDVSLCYDNSRLEPIQTEITFSWQQKYIGRKIIREKYDQLFDHNGYYPEIEDYLARGIDINLKPELDENDVITEIEYYKVSDSSEGYGRPVDKEYSLTKSDIKLFSKILDSVTVNTIDGEYQSLCESLSKSGQLAGGYRFHKQSKTKITVVAPDGKQASLTKTKLVQALYLSHYYLDVLFCEETLRDAPKLIAEQDIPIYLAILSAVDYSNYINLEKLKRKAEDRKLFRETERGVPALVEAVRDNDLERATQYAQYARFVMPSAGCADIPLFIAVSNKNNQMAELLLKHGAYSTQTVIDSEGKSVTPLYLAVQNRDYTMQKLLASYRGAWGHVRPGRYTRTMMNELYDFAAENSDLQALEILLNADQGENITYYDPTQLVEADNKKMIAFLSELPGVKIKWPLVCVKQAYSSSKELCIKMLQQGSNESVVEFLIEENDYEMLEICLKQHQYISITNKFVPIFTRDSKWYNLILSHTAPGYRNSFPDLANLRDRFLGGLIEKGDYRQYCEIIEKQNWSIPMDSLENGFINYKRKIQAQALKNNSQKDFTDFCNFILGHVNYKPKQSDYTTSDDLCFRYFSEALYSFADFKTCVRCLTTFPEKFLQDNETFGCAAEIALMDREDDFYRTCIKLKEENLTEENMPHLSRLLVHFLCKHRSNSKFYKYDDAESVEKKKAMSKKLREGIVTLLSIVPLVQLDEGLRKGDWLLPDDEWNLKKILIEEGISYQKIADYIGVRQDVLMKEINGS